MAAPLANVSQRLAQRTVRETRAGLAGRPVARRNGAPELPARDVALGQPPGTRHQDKREQQRDGGGGEQCGGRAEIVERDGEDGDEQCQQRLPEGEAEGGLAKWSPWRPRDTSGDRFPLTDSDELESRSTTKV